MTNITSVVAYRLHVWIRQISPMIWRRLLVRSDSTIADLHYTLQIAFGGSDTHYVRRLDVGPRHADSIGTPTTWVDTDGYLPAQITSFQRNGANVDITEFADQVVIDGDSFVVAYARVAVANRTSRSL